MLNTFQGALIFLLILISLPAGASPYDAAIIADHPVLYLAQDRLPRKTRLPNGDSATVFNGLSDYLEIPSSSRYSVPRTGALTIEAWIRPDTLQFPRDESDGYVYWAGKGEPGQYEYAGRMYSKDNDAPRPNRISGYAFNLDGGLGSGSYVQDDIKIHEWIYIAIIINTRGANKIISIYKNGVLRKTTPLSQFNVTPGFGNAPVRVGTRDFNSFFAGAIGKFALYDYPLSATQVLAHYKKMVLLR